MDAGGCPLNGSGGGGPEYGHSPGMITLEDLESFDEDPQMDSGHGSLEDEGEAMEDEQQGRLLNYWQVAARGHQVEVSPEMAQPIQQLTTNNHGRSEREQVPFSLITRKEKCGDVLYEKRSYEKANWACITVREDTYEQSICYGFMRIMKYICEQNSLGEYLGMSLPIVTVVHTDESRSVISRDVTVGYYLPTNYQAQPPQPVDNDIVIEVWPAAVVYTRAFGGPTNEVTIVDQIHAMAEVLDAPNACANDSFIIAGYTNPAHTNRRNEIWFLER